MTLQNLKPKEKELFSGEHVQVVTLRATTGSPAPQQLIILERQHKTYEISLIQFKKSLITSTSTSYQAFFILPAKRLREAQNQHYVAFN